MSKRFILIAIVVSFISGCSTTDTVQSVDYNSLIPDGWTVKSFAEGDLNKDSVPDIAAVIEKVDDSSHPRSLMLFLQEGDEYSLSVKTDTAILRYSEGGVWGDPFESIFINNGILELSFYGGSNWRWYSRYRFRFLDDGWYLTEATLGSYFTGTTTPDKADEEYYNLLTGDYIIRKADDNGFINTNKGNRGKRKLVNLNEFIVNSTEKQF